MIYKAEDRCKFCEHYLKNQACKAFPMGIPAAIYNGDVSHRIAIEGDNGFLFKRKNIEFPPIDDAFLDDNKL
jgi:hypothetical protein